MADIFDTIKGVLGSRPNNSESFAIDGFVSQINRTGIHRPCYFMVIINAPAKLQMPSMDKAAFSMRVESASLPSRNIQTIEQNYYGPVRRIPYRYQAIPLTLTVILSEDGREREFFQRWQDLMIGSSRTHGFDKNGATQGAPVAEFDSGYYNDATDGNVELRMYAESPSFQQGVKPSSDYFSFGDIPELARAVGFDPSIITNPFGLDVFGNQGKSPVVKEILKVRLREPFPIQVNDVQLNWADDAYSKINIEIQYRFYEEFHTRIEPTDSSTFAKDLRKGVEAFNRFSPVFSLVKGQGLAGGAKAVLNQSSGTIRNAAVAQKSILPF